MKPHYASYASELTKQTTVYVMQMNFHLIGEALFMAYASKVFCKSEGTTAVFTVKPKPKYHVTN
jgi:hypothetical protein